MTSSVSNIRRTCSYYEPSVQSSQLQIYHHHQQQQQQQQDDDDDDDEKMDEQSTSTTGHRQTDRDTDTESRTDKQTDGLPQTGDVDEVDDEGYSTKHSSSLTDEQTSSSTQTTSPSAAAAAISSTALPSPPPPRPLPRPAPAATSSASRTSQQTATALSDARAGPAPVPSRRAADENNSEKRPTPPVSRVKPMIRAPQQSVNNAQQTVIKPQPRKTTPSGQQSNDTPTQPDTPAAAAHAPSRGPVPVVAPRSHKLNSMSDVPSSIESLSVADVAKCVTLLGLTQTQADVMAKQGVDGKQLMTLSVSQLTEDLHFTPLDANKLARFARGWRPT